MNCLLIFPIITAWLCLQQEWEQQPGTTLFVKEYGDFFPELHKRMLWQALTLEKYNKVCKLTSSQMFPQTKNVQISGNTITKILGLSLSAVVKLEKKQGLSTNSVLQLKTSQQNILKINMQTYFFCFFAY